MTSTPSWLWLFHTVTVVVPEKQLAEAAPLRSTPPLVPSQEPQTSGWPVGSWLQWPLVHPFWPTHLVSPTWQISTSPLPQAPCWQVSAQLLRNWRVTDCLVAAAEAAAAAVVIVARRRRRERIAVILVIILLLFGFGELSLGEEIISFDW